MLGVKSGLYTIATLVVILCIICQYQIYQDLAVLLARGAQPVAAFGHLAYGINSLAVAEGAKVGGAGEGQSTPVRRAEEALALCDAWPGHLRAGLLRPNAMAAAWHEPRRLSRSTHEHEAIGPKLLGFRTLGLLKRLAVVGHAGIGRSRVWSSSCAIACSVWAFLACTSARSTLTAATHASSSSKNLVLRSLGPPLGSRSVVSRTVPIHLPIAALHLTPTCLEWRTGPAFRK